MIFNSSRVRACWRCSKDCAAWDASVPVKDPKASTGLMHKGQKPSLASKVGTGCGRALPSSIGYLGFSGFTPEKKRGRSRKPLFVPKALSKKNSLTVVLTSLKHTQFSPNIILLGWSGWMEAIANIYIYIYMFRWPCLCPVCGF